MNAPHTPTSGSLHPICSPCAVCVDVRARLKGHPDSRLDGESGLAAATMRGFERLLELGTWSEKFRAEAVELRKANTPKATGGAIVYENMAEAIDNLLLANVTDEPRGE